MEEASECFYVRIGLRYVKGLRKETALNILAQRSIRPFASIEDLKQRVPELQKDEMRILASIGALNFISCKVRTHRRSALWQVERASRPAGALFEAHLTMEGASSSFLPLDPMNSEERLVADFHGTGLTVGNHPMAQHRAQLNRIGVSPASRLASLSDSSFVRVAGAVIVRQRPGTAKGFVFLSLEDETGIANIIITPQHFEKDHSTVVHNSFLIVEGTLQNQDGVISVRAGNIKPFHLTRMAVPAHDFH
jgi:error-prone DNA polymerase